MNREDVAVPPQRCPGCRYSLDSAKAVGGTDVRPVEGDLTVCFNCGVSLRFGAGLRLVPLTMAEVDQLDPETRRSLAKATAAILEIQRRRRLQ